MKRLVLSALVVLALTPLAAPAALQAQEQQEVPEQEPEVRPQPFPAPPEQPPAERRPDQPPPGDIEPYGSEPDEGEAEVGTDIAVEQPDIDESGEQTDEVTGVLEDGYEEVRGEPSWYRQPIWVIVGLVLAVVVLILLFSGRRR